MQMRLVIFHAWVQLSIQSAARTLIPWGLVTLFSLSPEIKQGTQVCSCNILRRLICLGTWYPTNGRVRGGGEKLLEKGCLDRDREWGMLSAPTLLSSSLLLGPPGGKPAPTTTPMWPCCYRTSPSMSNCTLKSWVQFNLFHGVPSCQGSITALQKVTEMTGFIIFPRSDFSQQLLVFPFGSDSRQALGTLSSMKNHYLNTKTSGCYIWYSWDYWV